MTSSISSTSDGLVLPAVLLLNTIFYASCVFGCIQKHGNAENERNKHTAGVEPSLRG